MAESEVINVAQLKKIAEQAVHEPERRRFSARTRHVAERDLQFVKPLVARLIDARRLARRADEQP